MSLAMYESLIKWRGRPILPPVMTPEKRTEVRHLRNEAVRREQLRAKQLASAAEAGAVDDEGHPVDSSATSALLGGANTRTSRRLTRWRSEEEPTGIVRPLSSQTSSLSTSGGGWGRDGVTDQGTSPSRIPRSSSAQANLHQTRPSTYVRSRLLDHRTGEGVCVKSSATAVGKDAGWSGSTHRASRMKPEGPPVATRRSRASRRSVHQSCPAASMQGSQEALEQPPSSRHSELLLELHDRTADQGGWSENADEGPLCRDEDASTGSIAELAPGSPGRLERGGTFIVASSSASGGIETVLPCSDAKADLDDMAERMRVEMSSPTRTPGGQESDSASYESATEEDFSLTLSADVSWARDDDEPDESRSTSTTITTTSSSVKKVPPRPELTAAAAAAAVAADVAPPTIAVTSISAGSNSLVAVTTAGVASAMQPAVLIGNADDERRGASEASVLAEARGTPSKPVTPSALEGGPQPSGRVGRETSSAARRPASLGMRGLLHTAYREGSCGIDSDRRNGCNASAAESCNNANYLTASPVKTRRGVEGKRKAGAEIGSHDSLSLCGPVNAEQRTSAHPVDATTETRSSLDSEDEIEKGVGIIENREERVDDDAYPERFAQDNRRTQDGCESHKCLGKRHTYLILQAKQKTPTNLAATPEGNNLQELATRLSSCAQLVTSLTPHSSPVINKSLASLHESFRRATSLTSTSSPAEPTPPSSSGGDSQESCTVSGQAADLNANRPLQGNSRRDSAIITDDQQKQTQQQQQQQQNLITGNEVEGTRIPPVVASSDATEVSPSKILPTPLPRSTFSGSVGDICWADRNGNRNLTELRKVDLNSATARGFAKFTALCKGHLCRKLLASSRVQKLIRDIVDMVQLAIGLHQPLPGPGVTFRGRLRNTIRDNDEIDVEPDGPADVAHTEQDVLLHERVLLGLEESCHELHRLFFDTTSAERVALIRTSEGQAALEENLEVAELVRPVPPKRLSSATLKRRLRKLLEDERTTSLEGSSRGGFRRTCCATSSSHRVY